MTRVQWFQLVQGVFLGVVLLAILRARRAQMRAENRRAVFQKELLKTFSSRMPISPRGTLDSSGKDVESPQKQALLTTTFPLWDDATSDVVVLGVVSDASPEDIEAAYKRILKRFHPDRFDSWGPNFVDQAKKVVHRAQLARDRLLLGKS